MSERLLIQAKPRGLLRGQQNENDLAHRLENLARAYHQLYGHTTEQQRICAACTALDPSVLHPAPRDPDGRDG